MNWPSWDNNSEEDLVCYTKTLKLANKERRKVTYLKVGAAVYLRKKYYDLVIKDCTEMIDMTP